MLTDSSRVALARVRMLERAVRVQRLEPVQMARRLIRPRSMLRPSNLRRQPRTTQLCSERPCSSLRDKEVIERIKRSAVDKDAQFTRRTYPSLVNDGTARAFIEYNRRLDTSMHRITQLDPEEYCAQCGTALSDGFCTTCDLDLAETEANETLPPTNPVAELDFDKDPTPEYEPDTIVNGGLDDDSDSPGDESEDEDFMSELSWGDDGGNNTLD